MRLTINGEQKDISEGVNNIDKLLDSLSIKKQSTAAELNGKIIGQKEWNSAALKDGDRLEIITFVGGG